LPSLSQAGAKILKGGMTSFAQGAFMTFEEYLITKKIDSAAFKAAEQALWSEWKNLFEQVSEPSFTSQKLYQINPTRRKYQLKETPSIPAPPVAPPKPVKPVIKPKMS
jgi:hypothetical protein